ncbi:ribonuclease HI family protein [Natribacillus halophilus]|uniref:Ribonuclease HI n=1 Tax=Natribacillus halophilus TaxID=549003 RepID=A0A1G8J630_9BACI|nr:ribonuclease HI family protein [Natribacillus halophilus]SDI26715.1 ribonuclease HI [Natribacillus halophilus]
MTAEQVVHIYVDAACNGDPGVCGYGLFLKHPNGDVERKSLPSDHTHIHEAEFAALHEGMKWAQGTGYDHGRFFTDSQLVSDAVEQGRMKSARYTPLLHEVLLLSADFKWFDVAWVPKRANQEADHLAKKALLRM